METSLPLSVTKGWPLIGGVASMVSDPLNAVDPSNGCWNVPVKS
jgi:hypothetical protein